MEAMTAHDHDGGLAADLPRLVSRRRLLGLGGAGLAATLLSACGDDSASTTAAGVDSTPTPTPTVTGEIPEETAGPYPGDGSNGPNVLTESGIVRKDIRSSFGGYSGTAAGVPLTIRLTIVELEDGVSTPKEGAAVYLWHAAREGGYSL